MTTEPSVEIIRGPSAVAVLSPGSTTMPSRPSPARQSALRRGSVLPDARREDQRITTAEDRQVGTDVLADPMAEDVVRRPRALIARIERGQQVPEVVHTGQALQPGPMMQQVLDVIDVVAVPEQVHDHTGVDIARPGAHHQPFERRETHRDLGRPTPGSRTPRRRCRGATR